MRQGLQFGLLEISIGHGRCNFDYHAVHRHGDQTAITKKRVWRGKGFWAREAAYPHLTLNGLLIPVSAPALKRLEDFLDVQRLLAKPGREKGGALSSQGQGPYYFSEDLQPLVQFEAPGQFRGFGGLATAWRDQVAAIEPARAESGNVAPDDIAAQIPFARYNCWIEAQGLAQYIAGIDLGEIHPDLPYVYGAFHAEQWVADFWQELSRSEVRGYNITGRHSGFVLANRPDAPPFLLLNEAIPENAADLMAEPLDANSSAGLTLRNHLSELAESGQLFTPKEPERHRHMQPAAPPAPAATAGQPAARKPQPAV